MNNNRMEIKGAGGTSGGFMNFFAGLAMMGVGFYMLLNKIIVTSSFGMGSGLYRMGSVSVTSGMIFIPMIIGIMVIFYDYKKLWGWALAVVSFAAMIFGVISSVQIRMTTMSSFDAIVIFILAFGGLGMFLRSFKKT